MRSIQEGLRQAARWAWERDEVHHQATKRKIALQGLLYGTSFVVCLAVGTVLWLDGQRPLAVTIWLVGNGLTGFFGIIGVGWEALEYLARRQGDRAVATPKSERNELAPDLSLSRDSKISFLITVVLLSLLAAVTYLIDALA